MLKKGANRKSSVIKIGTCKKLIPCKEEGWGPKTSDKFEATECLYPIFPLQNERFVKSGIHVEKTGLHV